MNQWPPLLKAMWFRWVTADGRLTLCQVPEPEDDVEPEGGAPGLLGVAGVPGLLGDGAPIGLLVTEVPPPQAAITAVNRIVAKTTDSFTEILLFGGSNENHCEGLSLARLSQKQLSCIRCRCWCLRAGCCPGKS